MNAVALCMMLATLGASPRDRAASRVVVSVTDFGARPDSQTDATVAVQRAIAAAKAASGSLLRFPKGRYDFFPDEAARVAYHVTHTASEWETPSVAKTIGLLFQGVRDLTVEGNESLLVFHGKMTPLVLDQCDRVELKDLHLDFQRPTVSEIRVTAVANTYLEATVHPDSRYLIEKGRVVWVGEDWHSSGEIAQEYDPLVERTWRSWNPVTSAQLIEQVAPLRLRLHYGRRPDTRTGRVFQLRDALRDQVGMLVQRSRDITWRNVRVHYAHGLGIVGQSSENLTFEGVFFEPRADSGRTCAAFGDFLHLSGCRGKVRVSGCRFIGSQDDAISIHGTHLRIVQQPGPDRVLVRFMHPQSYGFDAFFPGDQIDFIHRRSLEPFGSGQVQSVERQSTRDVLLTLDRPVPAGIYREDCVENATWTPEVEIHDCFFSRIPARAISVATRRKVVIENNRFYRVLRTAVAIGDDAGPGFESGMARDVLVRGNEFTDLEGPVIHVWPENLDVDADRPVHRNIRVEANAFRLLNNPALWAKSTQGLEFVGNRLERRILEPAVSPSPILRLLGCRDVKIESNALEGRGINREIQTERMPRETVGQ